MAWIQDIYDTLFDPNTVCVARISGGKDSMCLPLAIRHLGLPLHRIVTTDVWATKDIPADLPEMWQWKQNAFLRLEELCGVKVERICAERNGEKLTYEDIFYKSIQRKKERKEGIYGFPMRAYNWCTSNLKTSVRISDINQAGGNSASVSSSFPKAPSARGERQIS